MRDDFVNGWSCGLFIILGVCFLNGHAVYAADDRDDVEVLKAAVDDWMSNVSFCCSYELKEGEADTLENGLEGKWAASPGQISTGVFCKWKDRIRVSRKFKLGPERVGGNDQNMELKNVPFDEIADGSLQLNYTPLESVNETPFGDVVLIYRRQKDLAFTAGTLSMDSIGPLTIARGKVSNPVKLNLAATPENDQTSDRLTIDANHVELVLKQNTGEWVETKRITFKIAAESPVVERIDTEYTPAPGSNGMPYRNVGQVIQFAKCGELMVPQEIRCVTSVSGTSAHPWRVWEWKSEDLGVRAPTEEDFVLNIPATTAVKGTKVEFPKGQNRSITLAKMTENDLLVPAFPVGSGQSPPLQSRWTGVSFIVVVANAILVAIVAWLLWRRKCASH